MKIIEKVEALNKEEASNNDKIHKLQAFMKDKSKEIKVYNEEILSEEEKNRINKLQKFII